MTDNENSVSPHVWATWTEDGKILFNDLFDLMRDQDFVLKAGDIRRDQAHWDTIAWNASFLAADLLTFHQNKRGVPSFA